VRPSKKKLLFIKRKSRALVFFIHKIVSTVSPGSQIVVPERPEVKKLSTGEVVSIGSVASLALLIVTAFK
jgi:hypothetical protein